MANSKDTWLSRSSRKLQSALRLLRTTGRGRSTTGSTGHNNNNNNNTTTTTTTTPGHSNNTLITSTPATTSHDLADGLRLDRRLSPLLLPLHRLGWRKQSQDIPQDRLPPDQEKTIYALSHLKLAQQGRPLVHQVVISNLMMYILSVHADVTLRRRGPRISRRRRPRTQLLNKEESESEEDSDEDDIPLAKLSDYSLSSETL